MRVLGPQRDRIMAVLAKGPSRCAEIALATGIPSASVSRVARDLVAAGFVVDTDPGGQYGLYALAAEAPAQGDRLHGPAYRKAEEDYIAARLAGRHARDAANRLCLTPSAATAFEAAFRYQSSAGSTRDNSCPKFAEHERHLAAVAKCGAFPGWPRAADLRGAHGG